MKKALFIALLVCVGLTAMAQVTLTFNPEKGEYEYQTEAIQEINQTIMGQEMAMNQKMVFVYSMNVIENNAAEVKTEFVFKEILYDLSSAMITMKYDSKSTATPSGMDAMMAKILGGMLNKKFQMTIAHDGSVKSVTGMQAIIDDMMKAAGANDMMAAQMGQQMQQQFNDEAIKSTFENSFKIYPGKAVKPGDSWAVEQKTGAAGMDVNVKNAYVLKSGNKEKAVADVKSTISGMGGQISGNQEGTVEFDVKSGLPVSSKMTQQIKGKVSANGMEIPMDIKSNVNVLVKKIK